MHPKKEKMKRIIPFTILLMTLAACTAQQVQTPEPAATETPKVNMPNPASVYCVSRMGTNLKFTLRLMAANPEYVFFRTAAPVTSGHISGESVVWQPKKAQHLPS